MSKPNLIFLHGTAGNSADFDQQIASFSKNWRCFALTLKGHDGLEAKANALTVKSLADDVENQLQRLVPNENYVLIGHSLGGLVALEIASRNSEYLKGIALLDTPMLIPQPVADSMKPLNDAFASDAYLPTLEGFANQYFFIDEDETALRKNLLTRLLGFPQNNFLQLWLASQNYQAEEPSAKLKTPLLYVNSAVPIDLEKLKTLVPSAVIKNTARKSHYSPIFSANEINSFLTQFLVLISS